MVLREVKRRSGLVAERCCDLGRGGHSQGPRDRVVGMGIGMVRGKLAGCSILPTGLSGLYNLSVVWHDAWGVGHDVCGHYCPTVASSMSTKGEALNEHTEGGKPRLPDPDRMA